MSEYATSADAANTEESAPPEPLLYRRWPLADALPWSLAVLLGIAAAGAVVAYVSQSWPVGAVACLLLALALTSFLMPVTYSLTPLGLGRSTLGRMRITPWQAFRAYQPRTQGIVLLDRPDPIPIDAFRSQFLPYGDDADETLCAVRYYLRHAEERSWQGTTQK